MDVAKRVRTQCMRNFTRSVNQFNEAHSKNLPLDLVTKAYDKVEMWYNKLEAAQDEFVMVAEEEAEDYLTGAGDSFQKALIAYGKFKKRSVDEERSFQEDQAVQNQRVEDDRKAKEDEEARAASQLKLREERKTKFEEDKVEFELAMDNFARVNAKIQEVVAGASDCDKRQKLKKLQDEMDSLKYKLVALGKTDHNEDLTNLKGIFVDSVEKPFSANQKWLLSELKHSGASQASAPLTKSTVGANTKKEAVTLPSFKGDVDSSPSPYLTYPVWRKRWDTLIQEYDEKWHINFLLDQLENSALEKKVG